MPKILIYAMLLFCHFSLFPQEYFPKNDGVKNSNLNHIAFTNATIYINANQKIEKGTLHIQQGKITQVGTNVKLPKNTQIINIDGRYIYPSFIDVYTNFGIEKPKRTAGFGRSPQYDATRSGYYWNDHIMPDVNASNHFTFDDKKAKEYTNTGFAVVGTHHHDGIARGTGMVVTLNQSATNNERILQAKATQHFSFSRSVVKNQSYPSSIMGTTALLRQMFHDVKWYQQGNAKTKDLALESLIQHQNLPAIFEAKNKLNNLRADQVGDLFNLQFTIVGSGYEYENIADIKATNATYIIPLNFPEAYDVSNPYQAEYVSLAAMRRWNQAPSNPKVLAENKVPFAFTTHNLKSPKEFMAQIRKAIKHGLNQTIALQALTSVPASILKNNKIGNLNPGSLANFIIASGPIFNDNTTLFETWVQGKKHVVNDFNQKDIRGQYALSLGENNLSLKITGEISKPKIEVSMDTLKLKSTIEYTNNWVVFSITKDEELHRMTAIVSKSSNKLSGRHILPDGTETNFIAIKQIDFETTKPTKKETPKPKVLPVTYPNIAYGNAKLPKAEDMLFKNATVWTSEFEGILKNTDVLVRNGKIAKIGKNISQENAQIIDATGKHLTAGIIDEHSHLALSSVNESGHNSSAEVTMEDVIDPNDIGVYRALAGGVTSAQLLHGSANPIGGRSAIVKFKWGENAKNMIYSNSPKFIKFALGENVKQSNWGSTETVRFPQTRMGVEQVFMDYFQQAKEYETLKKSGKPFRMDEEMETLVEILNAERFISCHSYVQSEINMLMKVAESFNFKINTFTHILEGYKVADIMKKHGVVGASTFSDWWAYKYEVNDAIPFNAAIMQKAGLNVAINSDDDEMIRRLNQEAAKTIKYGGMSETEAWKMVTINPAKMLHIDGRVGSIKEGKDADLVLWNNHPLSINAKPEKTIIDGAVYFDLAQDIEKRAAIKAERNQLIKQMIDAKNGGEKTQAPSKRETRDFHCDTDHLFEGFQDHD